MGAAHRQRHAAGSAAAARLEADDDGAEHRAQSGIFSDTRALVTLSAGDGGRVTSLGNESDLGTAFALATSLYGKNQIQFSGNLGYAAQSGAPSAGFRTSYSHGDADELAPEVTVTMRQMFMPGRLAASLMPLFRIGRRSGAANALAQHARWRADHRFAADGVRGFARCGDVSRPAQLFQPLCAADVCADRSRTISGSATRPEYRSRTISRAQANPSAIYKRT